MFKVGDVLMCTNINFVGDGIPLTGKIYVVNQDSKSGNEYCSIKPYKFKQNIENDGWLCSRFRLATEAEINNADFPSKLENIINEL